MGSAHPGLAVVNSAGGLHAGAVAVGVGHLLQERGIDPSVVVGTSGGIIASAYLHWRNDLDVWSLAHKLKPDPERIAALMDAETPPAEVISFFWHELRRNPRLLPGVVTGHVGSLMVILQEYGRLPELDSLSRRCPTLLAPYALLQRHLRAPSPPEFFQRIFKAGIAESRLIKERLQTDLPETWPDEKVLIVAQRVGGARTVFGGTDKNPSPAMACLASTAVPYIFPPVRIGAHLYADGGWHDRYNLWAAAQAGATHAIVVAAPAIAPSAESPKGNRDHVRLRRAVARAEAAGMRVLTITAPPGAHPQRGKTFDHREALKWMDAAYENAAARAPDIERFIYSPALSRPSRSPAPPMNEPRAVYPDLGLALA